METLVKRKRRGDYIHELVKRNEYVAMYETQISDGEIIGYEVFVIRRQEAQTVHMGGVPVELAEKELFPSNEMFGYLAFAPSSLERANERFDFLTARVEMKKRGIGIN